MIVIWVCGAMVLMGLAAVAMWGGKPLARPPAARADPDQLEVGPVGVRPPGVVLKELLWYLNIAVTAGIGSGVLMVGAGGRLAMRLLGATAGDAAQGRLTEAEQVVGEITVGGTIGFVVFFGIFGGLATGLLYVLIARWLPRGRLGGLAYGALLLVIFGTLIEPLRPSNEDFDVVGPGWLAVIVFGALVVAQGTLVAAFAGRRSTSLALIAPNFRALAVQIPLLALVVAGPSFLALVVVCGIILLLSRVEPVLRVVRSNAPVRAGRAALVVAAAIALPFFVLDVVDILGRGPAFGG